MKKISSLFILSLFSVVAFSQFTLGPKVGYLTQTLSVKQEDIKASLQDKAIFGLFMRIGNSVYVQPEVNYFTSGAVFKRPQQGSVNPIEQEVYLQNVQIPFFIGTKLINTRLFNLRAMMGPTANIVVEKRINTQESGTYINPIKEADIKDVYWGFQVGGGMDIASVTLDVQYIIGLSSIIGDVEIEGNPVLFDSKNQGFVATLGLKLF